MKKISFLSLAALVFIVISGFFTSCKKDSSDAPDLPPKESFAKDFTKMFTPKTSRNMSLDSVSYSYAVTAYLDIVYWNTIIYLNTAVPTAAFYESFNHKAEWSRKDKVWVWSYTVNYNGSYTAKLQAKEDGDNIKWEMYISKANEYNDFLWYTGTTDKNNTYGTWVLNDGPTSNQPYIQMDWHKSSEGVYDIKYTHVTPGIANNGGYVSYNESKETPYDRKYVIFWKEKEKTINIEWNNTTKDGRIQDTLNLKDNAWHYWNTVYQNDTTK